MIDTLEKIAADDEDGPATTLMSLDISGFDGAPEVVTALLGLQPTRTGRAGELYRNAAGRVTTKIIKASYWSLMSRADRRGLIIEHVVDLMQQVGGSVAAFSQLPPGISICVRCTIIPNGYLPVFELDADAIRSLGAIGAGFELDIFQMVGPGEADDANAPT